MSTGFAAFLDAWNRSRRLATPALHERIARWFDTRLAERERRLLLMAFRGAGKSTLLGLLAAWMLWRAPDLRILVLAAEGALAAKTVRTVRRVLERHPATGRLRPARAEEWAADRLTVPRRIVSRDPSLLARGVAANVTGAHADVVICDDVEVPNTAATPARRAELRARLAEIDYVLSPGGLQIYCGTPHSYYSIYAGEARPEAGETAPFLEGFARLALPLAPGVWPERFTEEEIALIRRRSGPARFASQMLLRPTSPAEGRLDAARLARYGGELDYREVGGRPALRLEGQPLVSASAWWDPAYGAAGRGDASVLAAVFTDAGGRRRLHRVAYLLHDPEAAADPATQLCEAVAREAARLCLPSIAVETNGVGRFLPGLLRRALDRAGHGAAVVERASRRPKDERILEAFDAPLAAGLLSAHESVFETPFLRELREWRPGGGGPDDGLDAAAGALLAEPVRLGARAPAARRDWRPGSGAHRARTGFRV